MYIDDCVDNIIFLIRMDDTVTLHKHINEVFFFPLQAGLFPVTLGAVTSNGTPGPQGSAPRQATSSQVLTVIEVDTNGKFPWTVPCLPVLVIDWTKGKVSCGGHVKEVLFQSSDPRLRLLSTPFEITASSTCIITIDNTQYTVIWEWECFDYNSEQSTSSANSSSGDENLVENVCQLDIDDEEEEDEEEFVVHTLPFKVMGVVYKTERQNHLKAACMKMQDDPNFVVKAMIEPDPDNDFDANAIRVLIDYGTGFKHVGFIAEELTKYVHRVLNSRRLQSASVYQIKFRTQWAKLGYYMTLFLSCKGEWPPQVVQASSRVQ